MSTTSTERGSGSNKRVAMFAFRYPVAYSPSVIHSATALAKRGFAVDIYVDKRVFAPIEPPHPAVRVFYCTRLAPVLKLEDLTAPQTSCPGEANRSGRANDRLRVWTNRRWLPLWLRRRYWRYVYGTQTGGIWLVPLLRYLFGAARRVLFRRYHYMIGVEPEGLWVCAVLAGMTKTPFYYHSLELFELREGANRRDRLRKRMERWANRKAAFTIVQDEARAAVLGRTNGISADRIRLVPVSEPGPCRTESSDVLRVRLGIPADRHIALVLGGIYSLNMSLEIAAQTEAPDWPLPWVLVFHGFTSNRDYLKQICHVGRNGRVYVSVNRVPFEEMDTLTASARVGIALYRPVDDNFRLSVFSSGKIALYFKCGLPVIVNDFPVTRPVIERYHCGVCLSDVAQLPDAIRRIEARYEEMRQGAARIFAEKYDFDRFYGPVADEIVVRSGTGGAG